MLSKTKLSKTVKRDLMIIGSIATVVSLSYGVLFWMEWLL